MTNISFYDLRFKTVTFILQGMVVGALVCGLFCCNLQRPVSQGIVGRVQWFEGNLMPGIGKEPVVGTPVKREIYIYQATRSSQTEMHNQVFYIDIETKLAKKLWTDENGNFRVRLEPGKYSVFTREPQGFFANRFSEGGYINPVEVREGEMTDILIRIDYMAAY